MIGGKKVRILENILDEMFQKVLTTDTMNTECKINMCNPHSIQQPPRKATQIF